jgi:hypothetical protein
MSLACARSCASASSSEPSPSGAMYPPPPPIPIDVRGVAEEGRAPPIAPAPPPVGGAPPFSRMYFISSSRK